MTSTQFAFTTNEGFSVIESNEEYKSIPIQLYCALSLILPRPDQLKSFKYSPLGNYLVAVLPKSYVCITNSQFRIQIYSTRAGSTGANLELLSELPLFNVLEFAFSPNETYLTTLSRFGNYFHPNDKIVKPAEGTPPPKNLQVWDVKTGKECLSFTQKNLSEWYGMYSYVRNIEWTEDESYCAKLGQGEVLFYDSKNFAKGVSSRLQLEGIQSFSLSPGKRPVIAVFLLGKNVHLIY